MIFQLSLSESGIHNLVIEHSLDEKRKTNSNVIQSPVFPEIYFLYFDCFGKDFICGIVTGIFFAGQADKNHVLGEVLHSRERHAGGLGRGNF
jgi:hypothetical protein